MHTHTGEPSELKSPNKSDKAANNSGVELQSITVTKQSRKGSNSGTSISNPLNAVGTKRDDYL